MSSKFLWVNHCITVVTAHYVSATISSQSISSTTFVDCVYIIVCERHHHIMVYQFICHNYILQLAPQYIYFYYKCSYIPLHFFTSINICHCWTYSCVNIISLAQPTLWLCKSSAAGWTLNWKLYCTYLYLCMLSQTSNQVWTVHSHSQPLTQSNW